MVKDAKACKKGQMLIKGKCTNIKKIEWVPLRRTFEAKNYPKGSKERVRLNKSSLTSEYMPSYRYIVYYGKQPFYDTFRTKRETEGFIEKEKERFEKTRGMTIKEMIRKGYL